MRSVTRLTVDKAEPPALKIRATAELSNPPRGHSCVTLLLLVGAPVSSSGVGRRLEPVRKSEALYAEEARATQAPVAFVASPDAASSARGTAATPRSHTVAELADELATTSAHFAPAATAGKWDTLKVMSCGPAAALGTARGGAKEIASAGPKGRPVPATEKKDAEKNTCVTPVPCTGPDGTCTKMEADAKERGPPPDKITAAAFDPPIVMPSFAGRHDERANVVSRKIAADAVARNNQRGETIAWERITQQLPMVSEIGDGKSAR